MTFSYAVTDGVAAPVATTASLDLTPVNDAPVTTPVTLAAIAEDSGARLITQAQLLANASDVDGPALTAINLAISSGNGTLVDNGNGTWSYTPAANDDTAVTFSYTVSDGVAAPVATTASLDITPVNDAPVTTPVTLTAIAEDSGARLITQAQLLANASDVDGPALTAINLAIASGLGTLVNNGNGTWSYTPAANDDTAVTFSYAVSDGIAAAVATTASLDLTPVNDAPVATPVTLTAIAEDSGPRLITQAELLANATDVDGPSLTAVNLAISSGGGTLVSNGNGTWSYAPAANDDTAVTFSYAVTDGVAAPVATTASLDLTPVNDAPVTTPVTLAAIAEDSGARLITQAQLLANASDVDGPALSAINLAIASGGGTLVNNGNGTWSYTPAANDDTAVTFSYAVSDGVAAAVATSATLDITPVNDAPVATNLSTAETYTEDTPLNLVDIVVSDVDSANVTATLTLSSAAVGSLSTAHAGAVTSTYNSGTGVWTASGAIADVNALLAGVTFTPAANFSGSFSIATSVSDGVAAAVTGTKAFADIAVIGDANDNLLTGTPGADTLRGLAGNDRLQGLAGNDLLDGGSDFDRAVYTDATGGITVNLAAGTVSGPGVGTDTLVAIEGVVGSDFADTFNATGFAGSTGMPGTPVGFNEFEGRGGNDTITSNVNGQGAELTRVSYVSATAAVIIDIAAGFAQGDASVGHDTLIGSGFSSVWGSAFDDTISGSNNPNFTAEVFAGFAGNDLIDGRGGFDRVDYNVDPNTTSGITVNLAAGTVTAIDPLDRTIGTDTLRSVEGVRGTNFADIYDATGFSGTSTNASSLGLFNEFTGNGGDDLITGNGNTRISFQIATAGVHVDFVTGIATGDLSVGTDHFTGVNAVQASMFDDTLLGGSTNDVFTGLAGNDSIDGGGGFDISSYNNIFFTTGGVNVNMAVGTVTGDLSSGVDTLRSIEGVQGTFFADVYVATGYGQTGALNVGNNGALNQFEGLGGDDQITGNGNTKILYSNATGGVAVHMAAGTADGDTSVGHDTFGGVYSVIGSNFADVYDATNFVGTSLGTYNEFQGQGGDDIISGNGNTQIRFDNATAGVTVDLATGNANGDASVGHDTFVGVNRVFGTNFNDTILGSSASDFLDGGNGNDTLNGLGGSDSLTGEGGADTFNYADGGGADTITDFNRAQGDTIDVRGVAGIATFADIQSRATVNAGNTVVDFGGGNTLTLIAVTSLLQSDFIFRTNFPTNGTSGADTLLGTPSPTRFQALTATTSSKAFKATILSTAV